MQSVDTLWAEHAASEFPRGVRGEDIDAAELALIDADVAGCVTTFLANGGRLDDQRHRVLSECLAALEDVEPSLGGEARAYFARVRLLAQETLRCLETGAAEA
jgi:hypothetical protein